MDTQYTDDTQLNISTPDSTVEACKGSFQCLEAVQNWMGRIRLELKPGKTEWLWLFGLQNWETFHCWSHVGLCN